MKASIFYFTKVAFQKETERFFLDAEETVKMLNESGLKNFVQVDTFIPALDSPKEQLAERLFAIYNDGTEEGNPLGTKAGQQKLVSLGAGHTSMSVNDFVVIDGEVLIVDSLGFKNIGQHNALSEVSA